jgi:TRAP-type C4-dicarboxylate transport system permease small subunit
MFPKRKNWIQSVTLFLTFMTTPIVGNLASAYAGGTIYIHAPEFVQNLTLLFINILNLAVFFIVLCYIYNIFWNNTSQKLRIDRKSYTYSFYSMSVAYIVYALIDIFKTNFSETVFGFVHNSVFIIITAYLYHLLEKLDLPT